MKVTLIISPEAFSFTIEDSDKKYLSVLEETMPDYVKIGYQGSVGYISIDRCKGSLQKSVFRRATAMNILNYLTESA